ncbi:Protein kinase C and casein kinase substrate in neurons protein 2 [Intoshia linei]|uniref:Protein kinase C and casein kinase substrate in neurons protein 2 n=1 Tax=Intoshia linei TaxID=1819745 RepID=A0A177AY25_9BILA|nr:Protein kinase C and casein kinase substrate in neurons protein 2 [Intoshia linei]
MHNNTYKDDVLVKSHQNGSFWEPNNYKTVVRRVDNIAKTCSDLTSCLQQRSEIEKIYARSLKEWDKKWSEVLDKSHEYGSNLDCWSTLLKTADTVANSHNEIKIKLDKQIGEIKQWKTTTLHKSLIGGYKESKVFDDDFRKCQKVWFKSYEKVNKLKKEYHFIKKMECTLHVNAKNCKENVNLSEEQKNKIADKYKKVILDSESLCNKYKAALAELDKLNPKYMEDMTDVYRRTDLVEKQRLDFLKKIILEFVQSDDNRINNVYLSAYDDLKLKFEKINFEKDLEDWSKMYGINMPMNWPVFQEYQPELQTISKSNTDVKVTSITTRTDLRTSIKNTNGAIHPPVSEKSETEVVDCDNDAISNENETQTHADGETISVNLEQAEGKKVIAIYEFKATDSDEFDLDIGEEFEMIKDADEKGWCTGRKNGRVGFFPKGYVKVVQ